MKTLTVDASTSQVAEGLRGALHRFEPAVREKSDGGYQVIVSLDGGDAHVVAILSALQRHVTERGDGPARVEMAGRNYTLHAEPD
jgi:hypothetical protein